MVAKGDDYWAARFFEKNALSAIGVVSRTPNWYPQDDMYKAIAAILASTQTRRVVTYGHSQGGYGALKYSRALGAAAALSFCPQWSINPDDVEQFDRRYTSHFRSELKNGLRIEQQDLSDNAYIFFDPYDKQDADNAQRLIALPQIRPVRVPFSGHGTVRLVTEGRIANDLIGLVATSPAPSIQKLRGLFRGIRKASKTYRSEKIASLIARLPRREQALATELLHVPENHRVMYQLLILTNKHDFKSATPLLDSLNPEALHSFSPAKLWNTFRRVGYLYGEVQLAKLLGPAFPNNPFIRLHAVNTFIHAGLFDHANSELGSIVKLPGALNSIDHIVRFSIQLKRYEILQHLLLTDQLSAPKKIRLRFLMVETYLQFSERARAFRVLNELALVCANLPDDLHRVSTYFLHIGEATFALELRRQLSRAAPQSDAFKLDLIEARIPLSRVLALDELDALTKSSKFNAQLWERASHLFSQLGENERAIKSLLKGIDLGGDEQACRHRLAHLLIRSGKWKKGIGELEKLYKISHLNNRLLPSLTQLSDKVQDFQLAVRFAKRNYLANKSDPDACILLAEMLVKSGDRAEAERFLTEFLKKISLRATSKATHWLRIAIQFRKLKNIDMERRVISAGVERHPNDQELSTLSSSIGLLDRYTGIAAPKISEIRVLPPQRSFKSLISSMFDGRFRG